VIRLDQVRLLSWAGLGLLAAQPALGSGYRHALPRPELEQLVAKPDPLRTGIRCGTS
jgi:hypothetical protein